MIDIPTTQELFDSIKSALETELNITIPTTGKSNLRAFCAVQAAKLKLTYLAIGKVQKNIFVDTADPASQGGTLERFGFVKLNRYPFPATAGEYLVNVTGTTGAIIPNGTTFKSDDDSKNPAQLYILDDGHTMAGSSDQILVRALETGLDSQLDPGDTMTATTPLNGVDQIGSVYSEFTEPVAAEDIEEYREKAINAYRLEPQGGAGADYRLWADEVQGVAESYPYVVAGNSSQINLFVEATIADSTDSKGTPTAAILAGVETAVEDPTVDRPGRKPLGVFLVNYLPIVVKTIDIEIASFTGIDAALEATILSAMTDALAEVRPFIDSIDVVADKNDIFDTNNIINIVLAAAPGSVFGAVTLKVDAVSVSTYTFDNGEIPFLNSITYT